MSLYWYSDQAVCPVFFVPRSPLDKFIEKFAKVSYACQGTRLVFLPALKRFFELVLVLALPGVSDNPFPSKLSL